MSPRRRSIRAKTKSVRSYQENSDEDISEAEPEFMDSPIVKRIRALE